MRFKSQKGVIDIVIAIFLLILGLIFMANYKVPKPSAGGEGTCSVEPTGTFILNNMPTYTPEKGILDDSGTESSYRLIRKNVKIDSLFFKTKKEGAYEHMTKLSQTVIGDDGKTYNIYALIGQGTGGVINYPKGFYSKYRFKAMSDQIFFYDLRLLFLIPVGDQEVDSGVTTTQQNPDKAQGPSRQLLVRLVDIYQDTKEYDSNNRLPNDAFSCKQVAGSTNNGIVMPDDPRPTKVQDQLKLHWFLFNEEYVGDEWVPHCKPAIYLYPPQKMEVNVKVDTKGYLTYTDPLYNKEVGWNATAYPDGKLEVSNNSLIKPYDYLYYESRVPDYLISKPEKGFVVKYDDLPSLYTEILPKLGLNAQQTQDFTDYWKKALKRAPYYFVGVMDQDNINFLEPLAITPKPDFINRVRVYFEALDQYKKVAPPELKSAGDFSIGNGFRVVEWGGMIKNDKDHPFTCSQ